MAVKDIPPYTPPHWGLPLMERIRPHRGNFSLRASPSFYVILSALSKVRVSAALRFINGNGELRNIKGNLGKSQGTLKLRIRGNPVIYGLCHILVTIITRALRLGVSRLIKGM